MTVADPLVAKDKKETLRHVPYGIVGDLAFESVHLDAIPCFLCYDGKNILVKDELVEFEDEHRRLLLKPVIDMPYAPYRFTKDEIKALSTINLENAIERAYEVILDTLRPYVDASEDYLRVDAAAILFSYFQHKFQSAPYIFKVGAPESGKSRSLRIVNSLAYRPMMAVAMTNSNIYRYLGKDVDGAGTIIHDEAENIHQNNDMLSIYNDGYTLGSKVPRITGERQEIQSYYFSYCIKFFGGVELPKNNAFVSRCIVQHFMQGTPEKLDIEDTDKDLFRQVRKGLLVLRLLKAFDKWKLVNTGLRGRSRELYAPLLSIVHGTKHYDALLTPMVKLDRERKRADFESKQGYIARAVVAYAADKDQAKQIFIPNDSVVGVLGLQEGVNEKGKKYLHSDDMPFTLTRWEIGRIQSENLKGKTCNTRIDGKQVRGHLFEPTTIRQLQMRYAATLETLDTEGVGS
jgi:hypothetical protein